MIWSFLLIHLAFYNLTYAGWHFCVYSKQFYALYCTHSIQKHNSFPFANHSHLLSKFCTSFCTCKFPFRILQVMLQKSSSVRFLTQKKNMQRIRRFSLSQHNSFSLFPSSLVHLPPSFHWIRAQCLRRTTTATARARISTPLWVLMKSPKKQWTPSSTSTSTVSSTRSTTFSQRRTSKTWRNSNTTDTIIHIFITTSLFHSAPSSASSFRDGSRMCYSAAVWSCFFLYRPNVVFLLISWSNRHRSLCLAWCWTW